MGKLKFGVSSIVLGKEQKTENLRYDSVEWGEAATIRDFFRAGGNPSPVTPTRCKLLYTAEKLFVLFVFDHVLVMWMSRLIFAWRV